MYSTMLTQNEGDIYQAAGYSPMASQLQAQPAVAAPPPQQQPAPAAQQGPDMWKQLGQMAASGGGSQVQAPALRSSAFGGGVQSDAPQTETQSHMKGRAGKIMEIVGSIMSFGATKAASQAQQNAASGG